MNNLHTYMILAEDVPDSLSRRLAVREEHLARVEQLNNEGRLVVAGPLPIDDPAIQPRPPGPLGFSGSLLLAKFANLQEAQEWTAQDVYVREKIWARTSVKPFKQVLP